MQRFHLDLNWPLAGHEGDSAISSPAIRVNANNNCSIDPEDGFTLDGEREFIFAILWRRQESTPDT